MNSYIIMTQKTYFFLIIITTLINFIIFIMTLLYINPYTSGIGGFVFFYASLFLLLFGSILYLSYFIHSVLMRWTSVFKNIQVSTRHGILFSFLIIGSLVLQSQAMLTWYNLIILILLSTFVEFLFISKRGPALYGRKTSQS